MSKPVAGSISLVIASAVMMYGCSKSSLTHSSDDPGNTSGISGSYFTTDRTQSPYYGDSVLYVQGSDRSAYLFSPVNTLGTGKYVAWPSGLTIDEQTGVIDISQSEPGARYNVGFIKAGTADTIYNQVTLAGITYPDGIYFMESEDSVLAPYYNTGSYSIWSSGDKQSSSLSASGGNAVFDENGPTGLTASDQQLNVNTANGSINLKNSIRSGLFGNTPKNGDNKKISIYYRLNDNSKMNLQKTSVVLHYYNTLADVPADLANACLSSQQTLSRSLSHPDSLNAGNITVYATTTTTTTTKSTPTMAPAPTTPRPPQLVIVNTGHH
ncbi:MAG: hypothetical protein P4L51_09100 [Puia sp.]|nr:hypothetical protein [Puia sp.]